LSRLRTFFLFGTALALAVVFAACGGSGGGNSDANPQQVVDDATFQGIHGGNLDLSLGIDAKGDQGGHIDVGLSGPFQSQGKGQLPQLDMTVKANGSINNQDVDFEGGLTLLADRGYVNYKGTDYEIDPATFGFVKTSIQQAQQKNGGAQGQSGLSQSCQNAVGKLKINDFVTNLTNEGTSDVGGTGTTHVSGDLVISTALDQLIKIAENPACSSQFGSAGGQLPSAAELDQAKALLGSAVKSAHVDLYVGDDNIVRRIALRLTIEPPAGTGSGPKEVDLDFDLSLSGVNETQTIEAPSEAKPLNDLFRQLGINPLSLLGNNGGLDLQGLSGAGGGAGGIGSLLQGINGATGGAGGGSNPGGISQAYLNCIQGASTPADLQKCAGLNN
jgi:hypothetical protein